jgi:hypothetical protein
MNYISNAIRMEVTFLYANLLFCLLETTIHFVHVSSFYFDQEILYTEDLTAILIALIINIYNIMKLFLGPPFINYDFYACLLAVRRASARQAALPYLVSL